MARLCEYLRNALAGRRVFELTCGTGYWTLQIAKLSESIFATDASEDVLEIARTKPIDPPLDEALMKAEETLHRAITGSAGNGPKQISDLLQGG